ncbi:MAG: MFS transporter [Chloroflexi bacterium]|nr:MFS transporter [Chloroflexota bacterium]
MLDKIKKSALYPNIGLIVLAYIAFIALGMPDGLLGVAWPSIRADFSIPLDAVGVLILSSMAGYLTSSFLSGLLVSRWGIGKVLMISCVMTGAALLSYTFAADWWLMVLLGTVSGLGAGGIDAGLNNYVAANFSDRLMQWLHASYGIGITLGPIIMTLSLSILNSWRIGYRIVALFQFLLAACFLLTLSLWKLKKQTEKSEDSKPQTENKAPFIETLRQLQVWLSMSLFFTYVGAEVSVGTWIYSLLTESRGIDATLAGYFVSSYWATFTVGRIIAGIFVKKLGVNTLVQGSVVVALLGTFLLIWNPSEVMNLLAVALIGFAIAPIFPSLMSGTNRRVGSRFATNTIGMQIAFTGLGAVVIPSFFGMLARHFSLEVIPVCLVVVFSVLFCLYRLSMQKACK